MIGGGVIHEDLRTATRQDGPALAYEDNAGYANAGLGLYLPFSFNGELWRIEGRYHIVLNDQAIHPGHTVPEEFLEDGRINFGFLYAFGREQPPPPPIEPPPPPPPPPPLPSVPPPPPGDADDDGVVDELDQCPGTPRWVRADAAGCTPDSDGDGVDETRDCCPSTPAGTAVDGQGCEPKPAAAPATLAPQPDADADNDGVVDRLDQCPHTIAGYAVNANGCVRIEDVVIKSVHFELDSDALTPDAYRLLNSVAASFKAQPGVVMEVAGHADASGSPAYNMTLSQQRAAVVRDFLIYSGVPPEQLMSAGYGETRPLGDNRTEEGRAQNRRVEFRKLGE
ncbi:MAG: OmpA family protein [Hydrocarboniphaga effusa]|nr:OmpA family protein [Hydrocarboniphaga effusa]